MSNHRQSPRGSQKSHPATNHISSSISSASSPLSPSRSQGNQASRSNGLSPGRVQSARSGSLNPDRGVHGDSPAHRSRDGQSMNTHSSPRPEATTRQTPDIPNRQYERGLDRPSSGFENSNRLSPPRYTKKSEPIANTYGTSSPSPCSPHGVPGEKSTKATKQMAAPAGSTTADKGITILAVNTKQTMNGDTYLICYRIDKPSPSLRSSAMKPPENAVVKKLGGVDFNIDSDFAFTDNQDFVILFSHSPDVSKAQGQIACDFPVTKVAIIRSLDVLCSYTQQSYPRSSAPGMEQ